MARGYSLHIGVNEVDPVHYGSDMRLYGCENDSRYYRDLAREMGCEKVKALRSSDATTGNLEKVLTDYATELQAGDLFILTYSGHGGSLKDYNYDEEDLKDETWCLYDRQYLDDELHEQFRRFKPGVRILVISDSCHSGTVTRDDADWSGLVEGTVYRGGQPPKVIERYLAKDQLTGIYERNKAGYDTLMQKTLEYSQETLPTYVLLMAACQDTETAKEFNGMGAFTQTLKAVLDKGEPLASYHDFMEKIDAGIPEVNLGYMKKKLQTPNLFPDGNTVFDFSGEQPFNI